MERETPSHTEQWESQQAENRPVSPWRSGLGAPQLQAPTWNHMVLPLRSRRELMPGTK